MTLAAGTKLGPYEILAPIGAGGMGEVYRARDPRLDRVVAIKVANENFSERFEREARAVAALNHPHICTLHDVGPNYLVMEYIEGQPIRGPVPLDRALTYAAQICDALDAAHSKNITHRDLKPANILVTKAGVKLLDFGLAKVEPAMAVAEATMTMALTGKGQFVGTLQYTSPEQLQGQDASPPSDIFSFGLVLYEMLTGKRAFDGNSAASVMAAILERPAPSITDVAPASLDRILKRCLEKDPEHRWQSARDLKSALELVGPDGQTVSGITPSPIAVLPKRPWLWPAVAALLAVSFAALTVTHFRETPRVERMQHYLMALPGNGVILSLAVSPDGRYLVVSAAEPNGKRQLWLRPTDAAEARALRGTENALSPFWSPDSRMIGFFAQGKLKKIAASGGPPESICDAPGNIRGGSWSKDDVILFASEPSENGAIRRVSANGGVPIDVIKGDHRFPAFTADGRHFLYLDRQGPPEKRGVYLATLDGGQTRRVLADTTSVVFVPASGTSGRLLFLRENSLMAQPFDAGTMQVSGDATPVAQGLSTINFEYVPVSASDNGLLVYWSGGDFNRMTQIGWFDRTGRALEQVAAPGAVAVPTISPDEKAVAFQRANGASGADIWIRDLARGADTRLTTDPSINSAPTWSSKGDRIAFHSTQGGGTSSLYQRAANGSGRDELLVKGPVTNQQWSKDGRYLVYVGSDPKTGRDIWVLPMTEGAAAERKPIPFLQTEFAEYHGQLSPDSKWMAYSSDESGQREVYVRPFPMAPGKWRVSTAGGEQPRWRGDGKELFYIGADGKMTAVTVTAAAGPMPSFAPGAPVPLFSVNIARIIAAPMLFQYDVTGDGKRFVIATTEAASAAPLNVMVNWQAGLKK